MDTKIKSGDSDGDAVSKLFIMLAPTIAATFLPTYPSINRDQFVKG